MSKKKASKRKTRTKAAQDEELSQWITIVILGALAVIAYMRLGLAGAFLYNLGRFLFGEFFYVVVGVIVIQIIIIMINGRSGNTNSKNPLAIILLLVALELGCALKAPAELKGWSILTDYIKDVPAYFASSPNPNAYGGIVGAALFACTSLAFDRIGTIVLVVALVIIAALLLVSLEVYKQAFASIRRFFTVPEDDDDEGDEEEEEEEVEIPEDAQPVAVEETGRLDLQHPYSGSSQPVKSIDIRADEGPAKEEDKVPEPEPAIPLNVQDDGQLHANFLDADGPLPAQEEPDEEEPEEPAPAEAEPEEEAEEDAAPAKAVKAAADKDAPAADAATAPKRPKPYHLPKYDLLDTVPPQSENGVNERAAREKGQSLIRILDNFDIHADLVATHIGPAVTKFEVRPDASVKVSKISGISDNIKMELAAKDVRIEAPIPGHNAVGIEIPNVESTPVRMKELITRIPVALRSQKMLFVLGKDLLGNTVTCRLDKMPHLLIAGATGSGKSVCINSIITSFLLRTKPDEVKLLLIDPKKVEFTQYAKIPHLIGPVISDAAQASNALKVIVQIMEQRYEVFSQTGVRNITVYNEKVKNDPTADKLQPMPYIVVIIDELADLMSVAGKEVEGSIQRITQLARAAGIHLIVATQRPSTDVITGIIKANIPSRIAFAVSSGIDSRTILDHIGAERLLGNGDMLYMPIGASAPVRVQGVFVSDEEIDRITQYCSAQGTPMYNDAFIRLEGVEGNEDTAVMSASDDPLYDEIKDYVIDVQKASTSLLQRRFGIGYNRAARMIDVLEEKGIIGPAQGSKPRDVYIKKDKNGDEE